MDFGLSQVDNEVLRGLDRKVNAIIAKGVDVRTVFVAAADAASTEGLVRSLSVAPPTPAGTLRSSSSNASTARRAAAPT